MGSVVLTGRPGLGGLQTHLSGGGGASTRRSPFSQNPALSRKSVLVKSFGHRLASESPRGTNPRCVVRGLWGFEELRVLRVACVVVTRLPRTVTPGVLPADQGTPPMPRAGKMADSVWGLSA